MLAVLAATFPFFALVAAGFVAVRAGWLPQAAIPGLNGFVLFFALPCMLFRFGASTPLAQLLDLSVAAVYVVVAVAMVGIALALQRRAGSGWNDAAFGALVTAFPNTGFMGVPLLVALLGAQAAGPAIATIAIDMVLTTSACVALSRLDAAGGPRQALGRALRGMAGNPLPWAIVAGGVVSAAALRLPQPIDRSVQLLGDAASPVALFTIGAVLARRGAPVQRSGATAMPAVLALAKLLLHPLLVFAAGHAARGAGLPLTPFAHTVLVLVAALPSASNVSLLAERYGADTARVARTILVSTALAFATFSAAVALLV